MKQKDSFPPPTNTCVINSKNNYIYIKYNEYR